MFAILFIVDQTCYILKNSKKDGSEKETIIDSFW